MLTRDESKEVGGQIFDLYSNFKESGKISRSIDQLPYTEDFDVLYRTVQDLFPRLTRNEVFVVLMNERKKSRKDKAPMASGPMIPLGPQVLGWGGRG